jgi:hypothetical protein
VWLWIRAAIPPIVVVLLGSRGGIDADAAFDGAQLASLDPLEDVDLARAVPERCDRLEIPAVKMSTLRGAGRADARRSGFT